MFVRQQETLDNKNVMLFNMDRVDIISIRTLGPEESVVEFHISGENQNHIVARYRTKGDAERNVERLMDACSESKHHLYDYTEHFEFS